MNVRMILVGSALAGWSVLSLLDVAAKAGVLLAVAAVVVLLMRRSSAAGRHLVLLCALTGALLLPLGFKLLPTWRVLPSWMRWEEAPQLLSATGSLSKAWSGLTEQLDPGSLSEIPDRSGPVLYVAPVVANASTPRPNIVRIPARWLVGGWAVIASLLILPLMVSSWALSRRASQAERVTTGPLMDALDQAKCELGMRGNIVLLAGAPDTMPMVWGVFRRYLLLPGGAEEWSSQRLGAVLLHEVSHLRRHDPLALLVGHLALAVHWFNPLAWWAIRQLRIEQENACDDAVLTHGVRSTDYAVEMLATASSFRASGLDCFTALTMARSTGIESRITGILDASKNRRSITWRLALCVTGIAVFVGFPLAILHAAEAKIAARGRILDRNGVVLAESREGGTRFYPRHETAAHLLGYLGKDKESGRFAGYAGVEKVSDRLLSEGGDISLALDIRVQQAVERAMKDAGVAKGAAVVLDCRNGDVLASASLPTFDPNELNPEIPKEKLVGLFRNPDAPMSNRVVASAPPGSIFKLVTALAACRAGKSDEVLECTGGEQFGDARFQCWTTLKGVGSHGWLDLHGGITNSCHCYFIQLAEKTGIEKIAGSAHLLGLGEVSGSAFLRENAGLFPGSAAAIKAFPEEDWRGRATAMMTLGQGPSLASPLQLAVLAAAVGNGEMVWVPRLTLDGPPRYRSDMLEQGWKKEDISTIRSALRDNVMVDGGVGKPARSTRVEIAGLSGTGLTVKRGKASSSSWFIAYAPAANPKYAMAVMVEKDSVSGDNVGGPIVRQAFEAICDGE